MKSPLEPVKGWDIYKSLKLVIPENPCWVLIHSSLIYFDLQSGKAKWSFLEAVSRLANEGYTLVFPSYTLSFTSTGKFSSAKTPSEVGVLSDWVYLLKNAIRTKHPIYSHVLIGPESGEAEKASVRTCFGKDSIFSIFGEKDATIVMFGCSWKYCTTFHYFEEKSNVPYRYLKTFKYCNSDDYTNMFVRDFQKKPKNDFKPAIEILNKKSLIKKFQLRSISLESCQFSDLFSISNELLSLDKFSFLTNARLVRKCINDEIQSQASSINVSILGSSNLDLLVSRFKEQSKKSLPECQMNVFSSKFGQIYTDLAIGKLKSQAPDFCFLPNRLEDIYQVAGIDFIDFKNLEPLERYLEFIKRVAALTSRKVFVHEFFIGNEQVNGPIFIENLDNSVEFLRQANNFLRTQIADYDNTLLVSCEAMLVNSFKYDPRIWYLGRIPFSVEVSGKISDAYCSFIRNEMGRTARLIILDLDNTLWGGVLGEEGIKGIKIGGDFPGNAFKDFQSTLIKLKSRGIALAVVSKNDEAIGLRALNEHPENLIRENDLAAYRINWTEKYLNIIEICDELSLGLQNILFVDDNPVEREKVRVNLPEVEVLDLPKDVSLYRSALLGSTHLGLSNFSSEDLNRSESYKKLKDFRKSKGSFKNINDFYMGLGIEVFIQEINEGNFSRASQLISKTNQFNTTTVRYNAKEIVEISASSDRVIRVIGYKDKMSNFENIGLFVLRKTIDELRIENFLLSCRILERGVETAALSWIFEYALKENMKEIVGEIIETERNSPAREFYQKHEFSFNNSISGWTSSVNSKVLCPEWVKLTER